MTKLREHSGRKAALILAAVLLSLLLAQVCYTLQFLPRLTLEDVAEALRSPYWWSRRRTLYNGISSNVGYYITLAIAYRCFGFSLFLAKLMRLAMHAISLLLLTRLLGRALTLKGVVAVLLCAGLSPTWLFLNTNAAEYGIDLQLFPILLSFGLALSFEAEIFGWFGSFVFGAAACWAAMIFPTILFYLPPLLAFLTYRRTWLHPKSASAAALAPHALAIACGFVAPVVVVLSVARDPWLLIYDPATHSGLFRGGGHSLSLQATALLAHGRIVLGDLFERGESYMFDIPGVEFGGPFGLLSLALLTVGCWGLRARLSKDPFFFWIAFSLLFLFFAPLAVSTLPGLRRSACVLVPFYGLLAVAWHHGEADNTPRFARYFVWAGTATLILAHLSSASQNFPWAKETNRRMTLPWLAQEGGPEASLGFWESFDYTGQALPCRQRLLSDCRFAEIFALIKAHRYWNGGFDAPLYAFNPESGKTQQLETTLWETRKWPE